MAQISAYEHLRRLMRQQNTASVDAVVIDVSASLVDARVVGSGRILRDLPLAQHIDPSGVFPGQECSLGVHGGEAYVLSVFRKAPATDTLYAPHTVEVGIPIIGVTEEVAGYRVRWSLSTPGVYHYELYGAQDSAGQFPSLLYDGEQTEFLAEKKLTYFAVRGVSWDGTKGPLSSWVGINKGSQAPTIKPVDINYVVHSYESDGHQFVWKYEPYDDIMPVHHFRIYRNSAPTFDGNEILAYDGLATEATIPYYVQDEGVPWGDYFCFQVIAEDGSRSADTWTVEYSLGVVEVATLNVTSFPGGYFYLDWWNLPDDKISHYEIRKAEDGTGTNDQACALFDRANQRDTFPFMSEDRGWLLYPNDGTFTYFRVVPVTHDGGNAGWTGWVTDATPADVNATQLQGSNISTTPPTDGQVLVWNATTSQWEPSAPTGGTGVEILDWIGW